MIVTVRTIGLLKALFGSGELEVTLPPGGTVDEVLSSLARRYGDRAAALFAQTGEATAQPSMRVMVNGRDIAVLGGRQAVLQDGDEVLVLTPMAGG